VSYGPSMRQMLRYLRHYPALREFVSHRFALRDVQVRYKQTALGAAWALIQYLTSPQAQIQRALAAGDPPAVQAAYTQQLFAKAPYFKDEQSVFAAATPRPVTPDYPKISEELQTALSSALTGQVSASDALAQAQSKIQTLTGG